MGKPSTEASWPDVVTQQTATARKTTETVHFPKNPNQTKCRLSERYRATLFSEKEHQVAWENHQQKRVGPMWSPSRLQQQEKTQKQCIFQKIQTKQSVDSPNDTERHCFLKKNIKLHGKTINRSELARCGHPADCNSKKKHRNSAFSKKSKP